MKSILSASDKTTIEKALSHELFAMLSYRQFSAAMKKAGFSGAAAFFDKESSDEMKHYIEWENFLNDCNVMGEVPEITESFEKPTDLHAAVQCAYDMERELLNFYILQLELSDNRVLHPILMEFIDNQRVAVGEYGDLLSTLNRVKDNIAGQLIVDGQMKESAQ